MSTIQPQEHRVTEQEIAGWPARVTSYRLGSTWYCSIDNVDPGATIARSEGDSREAAEAEALDKAERRLGRTRRHI